MLDSKVCNTCQELKPLECFTKHKQARGGHLGHCKPCLARKSKEYKDRDREKWRAIDRRSKKSEKAKYLDREAKRRYYLADPKKFLDRNKEYYQKNKEKVVKQALANRRLKRDHYAALAAERNSRRRTATPSWVCMSSIRDFYKKARQVTRVTGIKHEVDHIVPLQSPFVCGLHVPWNLRVITKSANAAKSNKVWPDMWDEDTTILSEV